MRAESGRGRSRPPLCRAHPPTGTLIDTASFPALAGCVVLEDSPSQVYGAALLMRFGSDPIRSSNLRASAQQTGSFPRGFRALGAAGFVVIQAPRVANAWGSSGITAVSVEVGMGVVKPVAELPPLGRVDIQGVQLGRRE